MTGVHRQTSELHAEVRRRLEADESADLIADELKVGKTTVYRWARAAGWELVSEERAKKRGRSLSQRNATKRGNNPSIARAMLEETNDIGLVASHLGVSKTTAYTWAHSSGWLPDPVDMAKRRIERLGLNISTPRYCQNPQCGELLVRKQYDDRPSGALNIERPRRFAERNYCDHDCEFPDPEPHFCKFCQKLLVRHLLEHRKQFADRCFCNHRCAANHPDKKYATPWATQLALDSPNRIPALRAANRTHEHRAIMRDVHLDREKRFSPDEIVAIRAAEGSITKIAEQYSISIAMVSLIKSGKSYQHVPPSLIVLLDYSSNKGRNNKKPRLFSDVQIRAIRADKRIYKSIAEEYHISFSMVGMIKHRRTYAHVEGGEIFIPTGRVLSGKDSPRAKSGLLSALLGTT